MVAPRTPRGTWLRERADPGALTCYLVRMLAPLQPERALTGYRPYWAHRFGTAKFLPTTRAEMDELGWDSCDVILVTGDAYVDHPSFGMALVGRLLESHGFRVGIIAQPNWRSVDPFRALGRPNLFFGVTAGNMDSMVNRYTSDKKIRRDDAYSPGGEAGLRPNRSTLVYTNRCREAYGDVPVIIGGIEASLRRIAHYDYWEDKVRRSILVDSKADLLLYGNAERAICDIAHRLGRGEAISDITDVRGTAVLAREMPEGFEEVRSSAVTPPGTVIARVDPYAETPPCDDAAPAADKLVPLTSRRPKAPRDKQVVRLPSYEEVKSDTTKYAHASRVLHLETNPHNARVLVQRHGDRDVWFNPPPLPLSTEEMDAVYDLPYARVPHPSYQGAKIPAYEMIRFSVTIMRGCFGGCSFCSITEHEGRIIQNRSEGSILREIENIRDNAPGFTGMISDVGGPTANMYRLACKSREVEAACRKPSCVYPGICDNLDTNHRHLVQLYRKARSLPGIKKVLVASGLRYDLAVRSPEYVKELVQHHVGGYLKIAPEHTQPGPLAKMMKPGIGSYERFKELFERYSKQAGKEQYLIPYFIAAHPGTTDEDMLELALWLKRNGFRADQVQAFLPGPMASASTMYHTDINPLRPIKQAEPVETAKSPRQRRLHKAFLRHHDAENWPMLRAALRRMGREDLIGPGKHQLIPPWQPRGTGQAQKRHGSPQPRKGAAYTQHTGLPPSPAHTARNAEAPGKRPRSKPKRRARS